MTYDELSAIVNKSYRETGDIRKTVKETGVSFNEVWDMTGMKDWFDFYETEDYRVEPAVIAPRLKSIGLGRTCLSA